MQVSFYVYYKLEEAHQHAARVAVQALFLELQRSEGVAGRLSKRVDDANTWMEIYEGVTDRIRFRSSLAAAVERSGLTALLQGQRHVEEFQEMGDTNPVPPSSI